MTDIPIQVEHFGYPVRLESVEPWTWRRIPLWSSEEPFSLCSLAGPLSLLAPVFVLGDDGRQMLLVKLLLERHGFERVKIE